MGGKLTLRNSTISNNRASNPTLAYGGGIVALDTATTITNSTISENSVFAVDTSASSGHTVYGTGGGIYAQGGTLNISHADFSGNVLYSVTTAPSATTSAQGSAPSRRQSRLTAVPSCTTI